MLTRRSLARLVSQVSAPSMRLLATATVDSLPRNAANFAALTPLDFLDRAAYTYGDAVAVIDGKMERTWKETRHRSAQLADGLVHHLGVTPGSVVSTLFDNTPEQVECHYAVPMAGCVLGAINTRLDAAGVAYILEHSGTAVLIVDDKYKRLANEAAVLLKASTGGALLPIVVASSDDSSGVPAPFAYESLVHSGDASFQWSRPNDEFSMMAINYTSGTTGRPKGVAVHHRGMYLTALGNTLAFGGMATEGSLRYLWTLPMFHCNGWAFPYTVAALGGAHVCLRSVDAKSIANAFSSDQGVTHLCGAPIVLGFAIEALKAQKEKLQAEQQKDEGKAMPPSPAVKMMVAAAPPPPSVLAEAAKAGLEVTHVYGLTESYGPAAVCEWRDKWDADSTATQAAKRSRQGVGYVTAGRFDVLDRETGSQVPADGETIGEVVFSGNQVMKGYYKDEAATLEAFKDGVFWTGDLGVRDPDGYIALKDRAKDIVISGGENISTIEVENVLVAHAAVAAAAVVALQDDKWGEVPCAFIEIDPLFPNKDGAFEEEALAEEIIAHTKSNLARFKAPKRIVFGPLPKTSTGKIQKHVLRERAKSLPPALTRVFSTARHSEDLSVEINPIPPPILRSSCSENGILTITLTRGSQRNALSGALIDELTAELTSLQHGRPEVRVVVIEGEGPAFSAGHDLKELQNLQQEDNDASILSLFKRCGKMTEMIRAAPVPVIAAVHGAAHAAGCEVAAACDLVVADIENATFATPGVKIGLFCHTPALAVSRALGGNRKAAKMMYTGEAVSAEEAHRIGLVHELAPAGGAKIAALKLAERIATASPFVIRHGKETLSRSAEVASNGTKHEIAAAAMASGLVHQDSVEGISAFLEKRRPKWVS